MQSLKGKKALITAGPTYEAIDPVRFIGNHSTGKMGYAIANVLAKKGCSVFLVSGPTNLTVEHKNITRIDVESAQQMYEACMDVFPDCDIAVMAAAVADYTVENPADKKIKKKDGNLILELVRTKDILHTLGKEKNKHQILVGFALETNNALENAKKKLKKKNADIIVLNTLQDKGAGFKHNTNKVTILDKRNNISKFELKPKPEVAKDIVDYLMNFEE